LPRLCLFFAVLGLLAQSQGGTISGSITDPDNRPVINAEVQLRRAEGGERWQGSTSSPKGAYAFTGLPPGTYELRVPSIGYTYQRFERKNIALGASQDLKLDVRIEFAGNLGTIGDDDATILRENRSRPPAGRPPRTRDGKPDFTGVWNGSNDPAPEPPSLLPWAEKVAESRQQKDNPSTLCLPGDVLLNSPNLFEIVQTPQQVVIIGEYALALRKIFLDGRGHPKDLNPTWMGHSIGRWEGDTLVVDTAGFNDRSWLDIYPHTEMLHVVTRYRRPDFGHMDVDITIEDPGTFTKPWKTRVMWDLLPGEEIQEFICNENNRDAEHMPGK